MSTDRDALYALLAASTRAATLLQATAEMADKHLKNTIEPTCSCGIPGLTCDGPDVDCDMHGLPSAAFEAGRREGAQEERDRVRIRGDLCRWCLRERQLGEEHGVEIRRTSDPEVDPDVACFDTRDQEIPHRSTDEEPF